jgi:hypothetical protein
VLSGARPEQTDIELPQTESGLWVKLALPPSINLATLKNLIGSYRIEWGRTPFTNIQRDTTWSGFAELLLNRADRRTLLARSLLDLEEIKPQLHPQRIVII